MDLQDKLDDWNRQLEQAQQYGLFFDCETVKGMIETIKEQQKQIERYKAELRVIDFYGIYPYK
jgi:hypothetical protein